MPHETTPARNRRPAGNRLRSEFADDPEMSELVRLFVEELPGRMAAVAGALASRDLAALRRLAHQLRGAAAGYGFPDIGTLAGGLEREVMEVASAADPRRLAALRARVDELVSICGRASGE